MRGIVVDVKVTKLSDINQVWMCVCVCVCC